jgi:hypothetical protein
VPSASQRSAHHAPSRSRCGHTWCRSARSRRRPGVASPPLSLAGRATASRITSEALQRKVCCNLASPRAQEECKRQAGPASLQGQPEEGRHRTRPRLHADNQPTTRPPSMHPQSRGTTLTASWHAAPTPPRKRTACTQPPLCALARADTPEQKSKRAADAATLPTSRAHRPVPPARRAASPLPAMPSSITDALFTRVWKARAHIL